MMTSTLLLGLASVALAATAFYFVGLRAGERLGRHQTRADLDSIVREAADQTNQQAQAAYERVTGQAVEQLQRAARTEREAERELGRSQLAETAAPLRDSLKEVQDLTRNLEKERSREQGKLQTLTSELSARVSEVHNSSTSLREALKGDRQARGRWGEIQLETLIESAGLTPHRDFETQKGMNGARPDLLLRLPNGGFLPVDAKVPLDDYLAATESTAPEAQEAALRKHARSVRAHADALSRKDYPAKVGAAPPFTVMYLPIESLLGEAIRHEPGLLQFAADRKVILATPHTLMGLLWSVAAMWRNETSTRNAEEMRNVGVELEKRLGIFLGHFADVGTQLAKTTAVYNNAVGSAEHRLTPQLRRLRELGGKPEDAPGDQLPAPVDVVPRRLLADDTDLAAERELI